MGRSPGADPTRARSIVAGVSLGVIFGAIGILLGILLGIKGYWLLVTAVAMGGVAGFIVMKFSSGFAEGSAAAIAAFVHPSGSSVPYEATFSAHDALEVAGDVAGAIAAYEATLVAEPENTRALRQAAELHVRAGNAGRAAELFGALRRVGASRESELYATQRLADLYLGALGDDGRALVELRRLAERFPGTREADGARVALRRLKEARERETGREPRDPAP